MKNYFLRSVRNRTLLRDSFSYFLLKVGILYKGIFGKVRVNTIYRKLKKEYKFSKINKNYEFIKKKDINYQKVIWIFWYQGMQNAPDIVKACYKSVVNTFKDKKVVIITKDNYKDYVNIPEFIIERLDANKMSITHFSDILRAVLLITYGGLWLDATVYCTGKQDYNYISSLDFFVYRDGWFENQTINMANWLIWSKPNNKLLKDTLLLLFNYWYKKDYACDYFIFHIFFKIVTEENEKLWNVIPYINHLDNHLLANDLLTPFDRQRYEYIKKETDFHKLTYKLNLLNNKEKSYYDYIIKKVR